MNDVTKKETWVEIVQRLWRQFLMLFGRGR